MWKQQRQTAELEDVPLWWSVAWSWVCAFPVQPARTLVSVAGIRHRQLLWPDSRSSATELDMVQIKDEPKMEKNSQQQSNGGWGRLTGHPRNETAGETVMTWAASALPFSLHTNATFAVFTQCATRNTSQFCSFYGRLFYISRKHSWQWKFPPQPAKCYLCCLNTDTFQTICLLSLWVNVRRFSPSGFFVLFCFCCKGKQVRLQFQFASYLPFFRLFGFNPTIACLSWSFHLIETSGSERNFPITSTLGTLVQYSMPQRHKNAAE